MTPAALKARKLIVLLADMCNSTASRPTWQRARYWCSNESPASSPFDGDETWECSGDNTDVTDRRPITQFGIAG